MERWEKLERAVVVVLAALLTALSIWTLVAGHRSFLLTLFLWPFMLSGIWEVFFEDHLDSDVPPGRLEKLLATGWLWFRRIALVCAAIFFGYVGIRGGLENESVALLVGLVLCALSLWVAVFGGGKQKSLSDDHEIHQRRRARYKWWI
ncbi:hypothetical protein ACG04Q_22460 [Roseateles sp. DXS20W]|uniref:Uncharacterized protein n=1 Tax=Pelomonas lactea TaxID=3299030 RepID=A0ABW7GRB2_9BURK